MASVLTEKQDYVDSLLRRKLTVVKAGSNGMKSFDDDFLKKRQVIARDDVSLNEKETDKLHKKVDFTIAILSKQPEFLSAFDNLTATAEEMDILKKAVLSYGYGELVKHFSSNSKLSVSVNANPKSDDSIKTFDIQVGKHVLLN